MRTLTSGQAEPTCEICAQEGYEPVCPSCFIDFQKSFETLVNYIGVRECQDAVNRNFDAGYGYRQGKTPAAEAADALMHMLINEYSVVAAQNWLQERRWY